MLLGTVSFGAYLNDEAAQLQGVENVRHGSLTVEERSPRFYAVDEGVLLPGWNRSSSHNVLVSVAALPMYGVLWLGSHLASPASLLLLGWSAAAYVTVTRGWSRWYEARTGRPWSWYADEPAKPPAGPADPATPGDEPGFWARRRTRLRSMTPAHWAVVGALALWTFAQWVQLPAIDYDTWGEVFAVQATHAVAAAAGFVLFYRVVQEETGSPRAAALASAALLLGPFVFWGVGIKYHGLAMVLAIATLWAYRRPGAWRLAALAPATAGVALTPLGAPVLVALVLTEAVRFVRAPRSRAQVGLVLAAVAASGLLLWAYAALVPTTFETLFPDGRRPGLAALLDEARSSLRYEGPRRSLLNLWAVFVDSRILPGTPLSVWALTPLTALAVLAPARLRGRWSRTLVLAGVGSLVFLALFVHAAHTQGDGQDNRFFTGMLPGLLLLGAAVAAPGLERMGAGHWRRVWRWLGAAFAASLAVLLVLGATGTSIVPGEPLRQLLNAAWILGTASWVALVALEAVPALRRRLGETGTSLWCARAHGVGLAAGALWVGLMVVLVHRVLPPWPFGSDAEGMSFLLPSLESLRQWWLPRLIPLG